jgi:GDP-L-fucose synthase
VDGWNESSKYQKNHLCLFTNGRIPMNQNVGKEKPVVLVLGSTGMVGRAIRRRLVRSGYPLAETPTSRCDLRNQAEANALISEIAPDWVVLAAAKVGGIHANNTYPAAFIYDNLMIQTNVMHASFLCQVKKLLFLGSSCIYPRDAPQPIKEEHLLSGYLEPTNEPYAIAKIAGIITARSYNRQHGTNFISLMPTNLYGPHDRYDLENSHVIPALIRKMDDAKRARAGHVEIWGSGRALREFLHVDDLADAAVFLMENYNSHEIINIGTGEDITIHQLALLIKETVGFEGEIRFDLSRPDGTPRKLLDVSRLTSLGWRYSIPLKEGLASTYTWYRENRHLARK